jgi:hypothetical protein
MTQQSDIAKQVRSAKEWLRCARDMATAAENRLRAGANYPELYALRADADAAAVRLEKAREDYYGWVSFQRQHQRRYG